MIAQLKTLHSCHCRSRRPNARLNPMTITRRVQKMGVRTTQMTKTSSWNLMSMNRQSYLCKSVLWVARGGFGTVPNPGVHGTWHWPPWFKMNNSNLWSGGLKGRISSTRRCIIWQFRTTNFNWRPRLRNTIRIVLTWSTCRLYSLVVGEFCERCDVALQVGVSTMEDQGFGPRRTPAGRKVIQDVDQDPEEGGKVMTCVCRWWAYSLRV